MILRTIGAIHGMNGKELFDLSRRQLERFCEYNEAERLESYLNIQKEKCGVSSEVFFL